MTDLSPHQFEGLFPADHPAMRERTPAEMSPEQYRDSPGAWHHGTYRAALPDHIPGGMSEGVHFGTLKSARERLNDFGPRKLGEMPYSERNLVKPDAPAEIHVRRISPDHGPIKGSEKNPLPDQGEDWDQDDRGAHRFAEFYHNDAEDIGSVSLRVPSVSGYMESHRGAVSRALREGGAVHPRTKGLLENHGGQGIDEPIPHVVEQAPMTPHSAAARQDAYRPEADHDSLLPYTVVGAVNGPRERVPGSAASHNRLDNDYPQFQVRPAVAFTATRGEAEAMTRPKGKPTLEKPAMWEHELSKDQFGRSKIPVTREAPRPQWRQAYRSED